jgi:hypothetical protein
MGNLHGLRRANESHGHANNGYEKDCSKRECLHSLTEFSGMNFHKANGEASSSLFDKK